jgi:enoyl-CoA hydratase/carnithine racemase
VPRGELDRHAFAYAERVAENAPLPIEGAFVAVRAALDRTDEALRAELEELKRRAIESEDFAEGVRAFLEKRPARFPMSPSADLPPAYPWWPPLPFPPPRTEKEKE